MIVIGVDPGISGGIVALRFDLGEKSEVVGAHTMPTLSLGTKQAVDPAEVCRVFRLYEGARVAFIEKVRAMPGQGVTSMINYGLGAGILQGAAAGIGLPYTLVDPQRWQRSLFVDLPKDDTKTLAALVASRLWPEMDFRASSRSRKPHLGLCDAACIAEYGRRSLL